MLRSMHAEGRSAGSSLARLSAYATVGALVVQFLLGMYTNLYVHVSPVEGIGGSGGMMGGGDDAGDEPGHVGLVGAHGAHDARLAPRDPGGALADRRGGRPQHQRDGSVGGGASREQNR